MLKVIACTGGHKAPSRVPRVQQYISYLKTLGIDMRECPSRAGLYPPEQNKFVRPAWALWNLVDHVPAVIRSHNYDVCLLQREMLSTLVTLEPLTKRPRILDVDDAIWVHRGGGFARRLAALCDHVICGNRFLAEQFSQWNPNVSILPTAVDTRRFTPRSHDDKRARPVIGWLGLSSGFSYLYAIESALREVLLRHPDAILRIVSDQTPCFHLLPAEQLECLTYVREQEVRQIQGMTVGIMPLDDSVVSRGKCSFKMLLYMACGIPVVVSPFGMNVEVLQNGEVGFGARNSSEWVESLEMLLNNPDLAARLGKAGRAAVEQHYSVEVLAPRLAETLFAVAKGYRPQPLSVDQEACR